MSGDDRPILASRIAFEGDKVYHEVSQPSTKMILEYVQELRKNKGVVDDLGAKGGKGETWGRQIAIVPFEYYYEAIHDGYQLDAKDPAFAQQELFRFLKSEKGQQCVI